MQAMLDYLGCGVMSRWLGLQRGSPYEQAPVERPAAAEAAQIVHTLLVENCGKHRDHVLHDRARVQKAFEAAAAMDAVCASSRLGAERDREARQKMWLLLAHQVEAGLGGPMEDQLEALWQKCDSNGDGKLSAREVRPPGSRHLNFASGLGPLRNLLSDHTTALAADLRNELGSERRVLAEARCGSNPFVVVLLEAFIASQEAQLALMAAVSRGDLSDSQLSSTFTQLDANGDGYIECHEFVANATEAFFANLVEHLSLIDGLGELGGQAEHALEIEQGLARVLETKEGVQSSLRHEVQQTQAEVLVGLELADGSEEASAARQRMWTLLSKQLVGGLDRPREAQLAALWDKYDADHSGYFSRGELARMMRDENAQARVGELSADELPHIERMIGDEANPMAALIGRARLLAKRAELELLRAHADGAADASVDAAYAKLDSRRDGRVGRDQFL
eukprot:6552658-Prymnesium_polylepis.1